MLAILFPGQGSQAVGMAADFAAEFAAARAIFEQADAASGLPLTRWICDGSEDDLARTEVTQPAVLAASTAIYRVLEPRLPRPPSFLAGHSLGEYSALVAGGALDFSDGVRLVRRRGALMQEAVPEGVGMMVAVMGLPGEQVAAICDAEPGRVEAANFNAPLQTVIAGDVAAVESAGLKLREAGAKRVITLPVSAPFHCALMAPAMEKLVPALAEIPLRDLRIPVISNVTAEPYREGAIARELLREQVCAPVRWVESVQRLVDLGVRVVLEVGPGKVLTSLAGRIAPELKRISVLTVSDLDPAIETLKEVLA